MTPEKILVDLASMGVRVYGTVIVSPFNTRDAPAKCAKINFLIERCGYRLTDGRGYPISPKLAEAAS